MNIARAIAVLAALWLLRLARCWVALLGLSHALGHGWAALLLLLVVAARQSWLLRLLAFGGALLALHWPWWGALLFVAPRLPLLLPGLITAALARLRHPRPLWAPPAGPGS